MEQFNLHEIGQGSFFTTCVYFDQHFKYQFSVCALFCLKLPQKFDETQNFMLCYCFNLKKFIYCHRNKILWNSGLEDDPIYFSP